MNGLLASMQSEFLLDTGGAGARWRRPTQVFPHWEHHTATHLDTSFYTPSSYSQGSQMKTQGKASEASGTPDPLLILWYQSVQYFHSYDVLLFKKKKKKGGG